MSTPDETTRVIIYTDSYRIDGRIELMHEARLTDFIRNAQDFIAVTAVTVSSKEGKALFTTPFLDIGREFVELIMPADLVAPV